MDRPRISTGKPKPAGCGDGCDEDGQDTFEDVVEAYIRHYRDRGMVRRRFFKRCSLEKAIHYAGQCKGLNGKRHPHHWRQSQNRLNRVEKILQKNADAMRACRTFDELHELIHHRIYAIHGVGDLLVYDAALCIGANLGLNPDRVHLHCGTKKGAQAILPIKGRKTLGLGELPAAFARLSCLEAEDCLCIYKNELARIARSSV